MATALRLLVFLHVAVKQRAFQTELQAATEGVAVTAVGRIADFDRALQEGQDAVLTLPVVLAARGLAPALRGMHHGFTEEPYALIAVDALPDPARVNTVGALDLLGRDGTDAFVRGLIGGKPKVERVTKVEDLLPLLQMQRVDAIVLCGSPVPGAQGRQPPQPGRARAGDGGGSAGGRQGGRRGTRSAGRPQAASGRALRVAGSGRVALARRAPRRREFLLSLPICAGAVVACSSAGRRLGSGSRYVELASSAPSHASKGTIRVAMPETRQTREVWTGLSDELSPDYSLVAVRAEGSATADAIAEAVRRHPPLGIVLMNNPTVTASRNFQHRSSAAKVSARRHRDDLLPGGTSLADRQRHRHQL